MRAAFSPRARRTARGPKPRSCGSATDEHRKLRRGCGRCAPKRGGSTHEPCARAARRTSQHALRRPGGRQRFLVRGPTWRYHRTDRAERRRQDDGVQLHHRLLQAERGTHRVAIRRSRRVGGAQRLDRARHAQRHARGRHAVSARAHARLSGGAQGPRRAHVSEHPPVPGHDRVGKSSGRPAQFPDVGVRLYRARRAGPALLRAGGTLRDRQGALLARPDRPHRPCRRSGRRIALWRPAAARDRSRHVHGPGAALPRRAGRRPQSERERRARPLSAQDPGRACDLDPSDRARHDRGDADFRPHRRARPWPKDRRRHAGRDSQRSQGDRGLSRRRGGGGRGARDRDAMMRIAPTSEVGMRALLGFSLFALMTAGAAGVGARAETYPTRPVTFVVPFAPGGGTEFLARLLGQRLEQRLGKPFVIENRPGGGGVIGALSVARAAPDGYTILMAPSPVMAINVALHKKLPYDPAVDFVPVALVVATPYVLVVAPSLPVQSVADLIELAKAKPGQLSFASAGLGTPHHLFAQLFKSMTGVDMTHVPYRGSVPALTDVAAGHVQLMFCDIPPSLGLIKEGKVRALGVSTKERVAALPDLASVAE